MFVGRDVLCCKVPEFSGADDCFVLAPETYGNRCVLAVSVRGGVVDAVFGCRVVL